MSAINEVWKQFRAVSILQFKSQSRSASGWTGQGIGIVKVREPSPDILLFEEVGSWRLNEQELRFTNVFRWTREENLLRLEHLRFGPEKPVFLFEMQCDTDEIWRSIAPHLCREDHYNASLHFADGRLFLNWTVRGPRHDDDISYIYE